jgi:pilus assembly protein CpaD
VSRRQFRKDLTMRSKFVLIALGSTLAACTNQMAKGPDVASAGLASVNVPVVSRADYVFDASAPGGTLGPSDAGRLEGWFQGLSLRYGDELYVDGGSDAAREQVAQIANHFGIAVLSGAPVTAGLVAPENLRVIVSRAEAHVPNCPNWSQPSEPDFANRAMSNFGCGVNSNIATMIANPEDLVHGRSSGGMADARTATKPVSNYRNAAPTGNAGLMDISTKKDK